MKAHYILPSFVALLALSHPATAQTVLFADSFDRADNASIDATLTGITNNTSTTFVGDDVYAEPHTGETAGGRNITDNMLNLAVGAGTSNVYVLHNFIDDEILTAGSFRVSMDVASYNQSGAAFGAGFAIGMDDELDAQLTADANGEGGDGRRMTGVFRLNEGDTAVLSDFWVGVRGDSTLTWGTRNTAGGTTSVPAKTGEISVQFNVSNFDQDGTVLYQIFFNGVSQGAGSFTWIDNNANFIGIDARDSSGVAIDNFTVETATPTEIASFTPSQTDISAASSSETITLDWTTDGIPANSSYRFTADPTAIFPSGNTGTVATGNDSGSVEIEIDGTLGDSEITFEVLNSESDVIAFFTTTIGVLEPTYTSTQEALRYDETDTSTQTFSAEIFDLINVPSGATYAIVDDGGNPSLSYQSATSGAIANGFFLDAEFVPAQGPVTFTIDLLNSDGTVFDTLTLTANTVPPAPATVTTLFADSYDRFAGVAVEDEDIDFSDLGMSGSLAPLVYQEVFEAGVTANGEGRANSLVISETNGLKAAVGAGMSAWALEHNFTDTQIENDGGLSLSFDAVAILGAMDDLRDRYIGFGFGLTEEEISSFTDEANITGTGIRGSVEANVGRGSADFYVSVTQNDLFQVFANGVLVSETPIDGDGLLDITNVRADLSFGDPVTYAADSFVFYQTYCNNLLISSGYFKLTNDAANRMAFSARATTETELDNLVVATVDQSYPGDPSVTEPVAQLSNVQTNAETGLVTAADIQITGGAGVLHIFELGNDLSAFPSVGVWGAGLPGYQSAVPNGISDEAGTVTLPAIGFPAEFTTNGFGRAEAIHWPAQ
jgi:hypothetical protein